MGKCGKCKFGESASRFLAKSATRKNLLNFVACHTVLNLPASNFCEVGHYFIELKPLLLIAYLKQHFAQQVEANSYKNENLKLKPRLQIAYLTQHFEVSEANSYKRGT